MEELKAERRKWEEQWWNQYRKKVVMEKLRETRKRLYENVSGKITKYLVPEVSKTQNQKFESMGEDKEEIMHKGHLDLNQHYHKHPKRDKKKCWYCHSPKHLKKKCPFIRCFYCSELGHIKALCQKKKLDFIFNCLQEKFRKEREKKEELNLKEKQRELEEKIFKFRAEHLEQFIRNDKGREVYGIKWKQIDFGD